MQDDASQRVVGSNLNDRKDFYHEISVNDHPDTYLDLYMYEIAYCIDLFYV